MKPWSVYVIAVVVLELKHMGIFSKYWKPLALIALVAFLLWRAYSAGYDSADGDWTTRWLKRDLTDSTLTLHKEVTERAEEQRRQRAADEEQNRANEELAKIKANADAADRARGGLQQQLAKLQREFAGSETGRLSAVAAASAAKAETARVLAQLLSESDKRAGIYAKEADRAYAAGQSCELTYDRVKGNN